MNYFSPVADYRLVKGWFELSSGIHEGKFYGACFLEEYSSPIRVVLSGLEAQEAARRITGKPLVKCVDLIESSDIENTKPDDTYEYESTQIQLPKQIADKLYQFSNTIPDDEIAEKGREDDPHVTVKYGLSGDSLDLVKEAIGGEPPIEFTIGLLDCFPASGDKEHDVLIALIDSDDLHNLNEMIAKAAPHVDTYPEYIPHATIAYLKPGAGSKYAKRDDLKGLNGVVDSVMYSNHDGVKTEIKLIGNSSEAGDVKLEMTSCGGVAIGNSSFFGDREVLFSRENKPKTRKRKKKVPKMPHENPKTGRVPTISQTGGKLGGNF